MAKMNWDGARRIENVSARGGESAHVERNGPPPKKDKHLRRVANRDLKLKALTLAKLYGHSPGRIRMLEKEYLLAQQKLDASTDQRADGPPGTRPGSGGGP